MGHHHELPLTGILELRPNKLRHHPEISPRDSRNYVLTTYKSCFTNQIGILHVDQSHAILINQPSFISHIKIIPTHHIQSMNQSHTFTLCISCPLHINSSKNIVSIQEQRRKIEPGAFSPSSSLR